VIIRQVAVACCVSIATVASPRPCSAQQAAFVQGLSELTTALEGTSGNEGARIGAALDRMAAALAVWDRDIAAAESTLRNTSTDVPALTVVARHLSLGRMYADRGRLADALMEFDAAATLAPERADAPLGSGLALQELGRSADAIKALQRARTLNAAAPAVAYYLFDAALLGGDVTAAQSASEPIASAYAQILRTKPENKTAPFVRLTALPGAAAGPPLLPPAAYIAAFHELARGKYESAIAEFRKAAATDPLITDPAAKSGLMARVFGALQQGRVADARALLDASGPPRDSSEAQRALGLVYWAMSDYARSIAALTTAI